MMRVLWLILAALSFVGGQAYLVYLLRKLDRFVGRKPGKEPTFTYDDSCRYPEENVVE